jgi:hypothetical protein
MVFRRIVRWTSWLSVFAILLFTCGLSAGYIYLNYTHEGAQWLFNQAVKHYVNADTVRYAKFNGTLAQGIELTDVEIVNFHIFKERNIIRIQNLALAVPNLDFRQAWVKIQNGRIQFPVSDPLGFYGKLAGGRYDLHLYTALLDVREIVTIFPNDLSLKNLKGTARHGAITVSGVYKNPVLDGEFLLEDLRYLGFSIHNLPAQFKLAVEKKNGQIVWNGTLTAPSGEVVSRLTKVKLEESKLIFNGPFRNPGLDIRGSSKIEQTILTFMLKGTKQKPELNLTSNPPRPKQILMVMMATGQDVTINNKLETEQLSPESVSEFVDYFTFSSDGGKFANNYVGLGNFSVTVDDNTRGVGIKRRVTDQVKVGVNVEETKTQAGVNNPNVTRTIGGEVQMSDNVTLGVDKKVTQSSDPTKQPATIPTERDNGEVDVMLKYKKHF